MSDRDDRYEDVDTSHLDDVEDGCGCTEMWEHTSDGREDEQNEADGDAESAERAD